MAYIKLEQFSGIAPRLGATTLAPNQAQRAKNVKIQSGELRPWRASTAAYTPGQAGVQSIYQLVNVVTGATRWLEWTAAGVDVVTSPVADTTDSRVYYTGDGAPKKTNWALATTSGAGVKPFPNAWLHMGVPAPAAAPTLSAATGSAETRTYVYTYLSTFGSVTEESAPSPAAQISLSTTTSPVTLSAFSTAPTTNYNITGIRIYRSVNSGTTANYLLVDQLSVNPATGALSAGTSLNGVAYTTSYVDNRTADQLGISLPSLNYNTPPSGLSGLVAMPNGILAGFVGNQVWFCEPYLPHTWPSNYVMTVPAQIVGLGVFGQTLVVLTNATPYLITGSTPGAMSQERLALPEPCVSKRSIVSDQFGVLYASPNGVVSIGSGQADVISRALFTKDEWATYQPSTIIGAIYQNMYMMFCSTVAGVRTCLVLTRGDTPPLVTLEVGALAVSVVRSTSDVYVLGADNVVYQLDADPVNNLQFEWVSKKFVLPKPTNFAACQGFLDWGYINSTTEYNAQVAAITASNNAAFAAGPLGGVLGGSALNTYQTNGSLLQNLPDPAAVRSVQITVIGDDVIRYADGIASQEIKRMPAAALDYVFEVQINGNAPVRRITLAESVLELKQI